MVNGSQEGDKRWNLQHEQWVKEEQGERDIWGGKSKREKGGEEGGKREAASQRHTKISMEASVTIEWGSALGSHLRDNVWSASCGIPFSLKKKKQKVQECKCKQ